MTMRKRLSSYRMAAGESVGFLTATAQWLEERNVHLKETSDYETNRTVTKNKDKDMIENEI